MEEEISRAELSPAFDEDGAMYPWVRRLLDEHDDLLERIRSLKDYLAGGEFAFVKPEMRLAMQSQLQAMEGYRLAIEHRMALLGMYRGRA
jgi:hypothetical protein